MCKHLKSIDLAACMKVAKRVGSILESIAELIIKELEGKTVDHAPDPQEQPPRRTRERPKGTEVRTDR